MSSTINLGLSGTAELQVGWGVPQADGTVEERLTWLENHMTDAGRQLGDLNAWHKQEVRDRQTAMEEERAARKSGEQSLRGSLGNLAGGGLRLQAWGVACLLVGTIMTAIW